MRPTVTVHMGNIFEGGADLTAMSCGAKGTISSAIESWVDRYKLPRPKDLAPQMRLGDVTKVHQISEATNITKLICYGASVFNDTTSGEAIERIGRGLGQHTVDKPEIRIVESVLFGTGYGRLADEPAAIALSDGFLATAAEGASLTIFVFGHERHAKIEAALRHSDDTFWQRLRGAVNVRPGAFEFSVDLKKVFKKRRQR